MRGHGCINGMLQGTDKYSAPVPVIGLYIAAASAVCALLVLYDIVIYGFIKRQRWLPCKWFKLNSVTLSLIGIVVKLTVDLTTSMPSALDQLSKLAGTTCLCIYMCYIYPSISDMKDSTNMFALSILVITVCVNICIQLSTGVIVLFVPEHIVVMCIMLLLLAILWRLVFLSKYETRDSVATGKSNFCKHDKSWERPNSFLQRLKDCYLSNYQVNPQFRSCRRMDCGTVGDLSLISLAILIQAAIRSIVLKKENLCTGKSSDYQWSMAMIVVTQFFFIIIGSFASCLRRWTMLSLLDVHTADRTRIIEEPYSSNPILKGKFSLVIAVENVYYVIIFISWGLGFFLGMLFSWVMSCMRKAFSRALLMVKYYTSSEEEWRNSRDEWWENRWDTEFESFLGFIDHSSDGWVNRKSRSNMEKLIEGSKRKSNDLCNLLSSIIPVHTVIGSFDSPRYQEPTDEIQLPPARLHPLVVLVRLMEVAIPESPCQDRIVKTLREAFETLHFIEKYMHNTTLGDIKETEIAKALWRAGDFSRLLPVNLRSSDLSPPPVDHAFRIMNCIYKRMGEKTYSADRVSATVELIRDFLKKRSYSSTEELGKFMQDLSAYMLNVMLAQLPDAIFKAVSQSPDDEFEERVCQSLKHLCMFESWDGIHKWEPPQGFENCTGLLDPEKPAPPNVVVQNPALASRNDTPQSDVPANPSVQDEGEDQGGTGIQLPATLNEGNEILRSAEHHVTITGEDAIVEIESI
ncbi:hypothetical protein ACHQM5_011752 [Ranunculus cassubicifolius]